MGQGETLLKLEELERKLLKELENIRDQNEIIQKIWDKALSTEDLSLILGITVVSVSRSIKKLILKDKILEVRTNSDRRKIKYITKKIGEKL